MQNRSRLAVETKYAGDLKPLLTKNNLYVHVCVCCSAGEIVSLSAHMNYKLVLVSIRHPDRCFNFEPFLFKLFTIRYFLQFQRILNLGLLETNLLLQNWLQGF